VRYHIGEDPECLLSVTAPDSSKQFDLIAISPNSKVVAVTSGSTLYFYSLDGKLFDTIASTHEGTQLFSVLSMTFAEPIVSISWAPNSKAVLTSGGSSSKVWKPEF
jgi:WD40 repeat protein